MEAIAVAMILFLIMSIGGVYVQAPMMKRLIVTFGCPPVFVPKTDPIFGVIVFEIARGSVVPRMKKFVCSVS